MEGVSCLSVIRSRPWPPLHLPCCLRARCTPRRNPTSSCPIKYTGGLALDLGNRLNPNILTGEMAAEGPAWGQYWSFVRAPDGFLRVRNRLAPGMCLDVAGDGAIYMDTCGNQIGQRWNLRGQNGNVDVINPFKPGHRLDVTANAPNIALSVPCSGATGQLWSVTATNVWPDPVQAARLISTPDSFHSNRPRRSISKTSWLSGRSFRVRVTANRSRLR